MIVTFARLLPVLGLGLLALGCGVEDTPSSRSSALTLTIPNQMESLLSLDKVRQRATFPLHRGRGPNGHRVYFILTDTSDLKEAVRLGINWAPKLQHALGTAAVQQAVSLARDEADDRDEDGDGADDGDKRRGSELRVRFSGTVDFRPNRAVVPGPDLFPLGAGTEPGSVGDAHYSPLFTMDNRIVYNGAHVANHTGRHDKVLALNTEHRRVTMRLTAGFYLGRDVLYLSTESSVPPIAALEGATYAPNLAAAPQPGSDDSSLSAREAIIPIVNGPMGVNNPQRQGLRSAVAGEGDPLNIIREEPECSDPAVPANCSALDYSPLWDVHPVLWTDAAIMAGQRHRVRNHQDVETLFNAGQLVTAAPGGPENMDPEIRGLRAAGIIVNCPPVFVAPAP